MAERATEWTATWSAPPTDLLTVDAGSNRLDCVHWTPSHAERFALDLTERGGLPRLPGPMPVAAVVAVGSPGHVPVVTSLANRLEATLHLAGRDLPCPLQVPATGIAPRRWIATLAAQKGFGGACLVIDVADTLSIDVIDDARTHWPAPPETEPDRANLRDFCRSVDARVVALAQAADVDGPLLVITGSDAALYSENGRLPTQLVPDLHHRGLVELWTIAAATRDDTP